MSQTGLQDDRTTGPPDSGRNSGPNGGDLPNPVVRWSRCPVVQSDPVKAAVKPENKGSQTWSNLVKPKMFFDSNLDLGSGF